MMAGLALDDGPDAELSADALHQPVQNRRTADPRRKRSRIMKIQIQHTDGAITCFDMKDKQRCMDLIGSIKPSEFFSQPLLRVQTGKQTSIFNLKAVESIYFATSVKAEIRKPTGTSDFRTIPETEYREKLEILRLQDEPIHNLFEPGQSIETLLALHCVSGKKHFLHVEMIAGLRVEQLMDLHTRLERLTSVIPCSPGGYIAINPSAIKRIEIYPAPQETELTAWLVD